MKAKNKRKDRQTYAAFRGEITRRFFSGVFLSMVIVCALYVFLWRQRGGNAVVWFFVHVLRMEYMDAVQSYYNISGNYRDIVFLVSIVLVFATPLLLLFRWMTRYFDEINSGIDALLDPEKKSIRLSPEMYPLERKLTTVQETLECQREEAALSEQRKNDLVMYLAHDIRTPLTSVIGYLSLLDEDRPLSEEQQARYIHITLEKANRLERMVDEFFEITRYHSQQITLKKAKVDLSYLLVQLAAELSPVLTRRGNRLELRVEDDLALSADADKLARVFANLLKNAAAYSYPDTVITLTAQRQEGRIAVTLQNEADHIPEEKLPALFDRFFRLDQARGSDTGGTGLGLVIAREIVLLHGGDIEAASEGNTVTFTVTLPLPPAAR